MHPTCTRRIQFCAGHRVHQHESKCANLHGHNYVVLFEAEALDLDGIGRVIDFSVLKEKLGGWIDEHWDHGMILFAKDPLRWLWTGTGHASEVTPYDSTLKHHLMPCNPTAENMARYLGEVVGPAVLPESIRLTSVVVHETENCSATWRLI